MYLSEAEAELIIANNPNCQFQGEITETLECLDIYLNEWLGCSYLPQEYTCEITPNHNGLIYLQHSPILSINEILYNNIQVYPGDIHPSSWSALALYDGKNTINVSGYCSSYLDPIFTIKYTAGYDPLPPSVVLGAKKLLQTLIKYNGDWLALTQPYRDLKRVELPTTEGGIKREYNISSIPSGTTLLDMVLTPLLSRYRKTIFY